MMKKLSVLGFLLSAFAVSAATVTFPLVDLTGTAAARKLTISPKYSVSKVGTSIAAGGSIVIPATNASPSVVLVTGQYTVAFDGLPMTMSLNIPSGSGSYSATDAALSPSLTVYTYTNGAVASGWPTNWPASSITNQIQPAQIAGTLTNNTTGNADSATSALMAFGVGSSGSAAKQYLALDDDGYTTATFDGHLWTNILYASTAGYLTGYTLDNERYLLFTNNQAGAGITYNDLSGYFEFNDVKTVKAFAFEGDGSGLTGIPGAQITGSLTNNTSGKSAYATNAGYLLGIFDGVQYSLIYTNGGSEGINFDQQSSRYNFGNAYLTAAGFEGDGSALTGVPYATAARLATNATYATNLASTTWGGISNATTVATNLVIAASGNVGVNKSNPGNTLDVSGGISASTAVQAPRLSGSYSAASIYTETTNGVTSANGNSYRFAIGPDLQGAISSNVMRLRWGTTNGTVIVGATTNYTQGYALNVNGNSIVSGLASASSNIVGTTYPTLLTSDSTGLVTDQPITVGGVTPGVTFGSGGPIVSATGSRLTGNTVLNVWSNSLQFGTPGSAWMTITNGKVGINKVNSIYDLEVNGTFVVGGYIFSPYYTASGYYSAGTYVSLGNNAVRLYAGGGGLAVRDSTGTNGAALNALSAVITNTLTASNIVSQTTVTATNFLLSVPRWKDSPIVFTWGTGATAPARTAFVPANGISALGFVNNDVADFQTQFGHDIAPSNSTLYTEFHLHAMPMDATAYSSTTCRKTFTVKYFGAALNVSNAVTILTNVTPVTNVFTDVLLEKNAQVLFEGNHWSFTNFYPGISGKVWGTVTVTDAGNSNYTGAVTLDMDFHYPVDRMGSSADTAP